ncbi:Proteasome subunit [Pseudooceanicola marinus]|uniref:Proteasome subunit n=1 Tax=Pseudooceanicola marinus TaxID=396013 RepID=A0A1X6Y9S4_9RHOB|nr:proteasome-type protease [Pseudooceanicola marinus]PJE33131.1 peptidase [Pseudooceanicola marinus]SLN14555.1 Proteasome subunit [Pseudooceanicola marinus]
MTYCVALQLDRGLLFMSDTRTNSGVDNISTFRKMVHFEVPGERCITLMTAGNLATTQAVVSLLQERSKSPDERSPDILQLPTMFQVAGLIGQTLREVISRHDDNGQKASSTFSATILLGGQIAGGEPRIYLIYPEGNFIEASADTPFFQIGETKYGRPILVRAYEADMSFEDAMKLVLVSFDSTIKANLSVALPLDYHVYEADSLHLGRTGRIEADDPYFQDISSGWGVALRDAFAALPEFSFEDSAAPHEDTGGA